MERGSLKFGLTAGVNKKKEGKGKCCEGGRKEVERKQDRFEVTGSIGIIWLFPGELTIFLRLLFS